MLALACAGLLATGACGGATAEPRPTIPDLSSLASQRAAPGGNPSLPVLAEDPDIFELTGLNTYRGVWELNYEGDVVDVAGYRQAIVAIEATRVPDRTRVIVEIDNQRSEYILLEDDAWYREGEGLYQPFPPELGDPRDLFSLQRVHRSLTSHERSLTYVSAEPIGGRGALHYTGGVEALFALMGMASLEQSNTVVEAAHVDIWVDPAGFVVAFDAVLSISDERDASTMQLTWQVQDLGAEIVIEPPADEERWSVEAVVDHQAIDQAQTDLRAALGAAKVHYDGRGTYDATPDELFSIEPGLALTDEVSSAGMGVIWYLADDQRILFATESTQGSWFCIADVVLVGTSFGVGSSLTSVDEFRECEAVSW